MEKNSLIQYTGQGGTYLKAGWKMIPFFVLCVLQDASALKGPRLVTGDPGGTVTIECRYTPTSVNKHQRKYWCRLYLPQRVCHTVISTNLFISPHYQDRVTLQDFPSRGIFIVTLTKLAPEDAGYYRCGIGSKTAMLSFRMNLTVSTVNHSLESTILTIPSSIIPITTRDQTMEELDTSTSALGRQELDTFQVVKRWEARTRRTETTTTDITQVPGSIGVITTVTGGQDHDTTLLAEGWETRTREREITPDKVTPAPGSIGETTTVRGGQDHDTTLLAEGWETRTCKREITPDKITPAPGSIGETTTVIGGQGFDTTLLAEGWETRTREREITPDKVTPAPGSIGETTTVIGGQGLDAILLAGRWKTGSSRSDATPDKITQVPVSTGATDPVTDRWDTKTITTTSVPGSQVLDTTLVINDHGAETCRGDIILTGVTKASGTIRAITSAVDRQAPRTFGVTPPAAGRQDLDTSGAGKELEVGISRGGLTQIPVQVSSKTTRSPETVRLAIPSTGDWILETTKVADSIPEGQTSRAKVTSNIPKGGLIWGTRATTKTIGAIKERLTKETVNIEIPLITIKNIPGTIRPSTMVRGSFRELPAGTAQQTQGITRATAPDVDVGVRISGTFRKRKASAFRGTAATGRESHSKEPLRRIPGTGLMIPPSNKSCMENSSPDQRHVSRILVIFSTVLLPLALLVLLLLLRKLRKRFILQTQKMPTLSPIQLTNFQDLPKKLSLEALQTQEV